MTNTITDRETRKIIHTARQPITQMNFGTPKLTVGEVAKFLQLSTSKMYKLIENNQIPYYRLGGAIRLDLAEVEDWLATHHVPVEITSSPQDLQH